jgi:hypothetical protein
MEYVNKYVGKMWSLVPKQFVNVILTEVILFRRLFFSLYNSIFLMLVYFALSITSKNKQL